MTRLIDDLLVFSKAGRQKLTSGSIDTSRLIKHVIEEVDAKKLNARAQITVLDLAPCEGDSALITQVWVNLITNALKYSSKKEQPIIEIGSKDRVYFIRDNGAGFDMRYAESLFGVFQRLHRQDEFDGTGVGLAIVQRIIHRHQGRIWAEAAVEKGATFYFTLNESAPLEPTTPA
jgi:light-regulated signal transduction histidine kinase (bacteriophytochrome)